MDDMAKHKTIIDVIEEAISYLEYVEDDLRTQLIDYESKDYLSPLIAAKTRGTRRLIEKLKFAAGLV